jgi:PAS domain-containing protein
MEPTLTLAMVLVVTSVLSVLAALLIAGALDRGRRPGSAAPLDRDAVFLIADGVVVDANDRGTALLATLRDRDLPGADGAAAPGGPAGSLQRLVHHLGPAFPDMAARLSAQAGGDDWVLSASDGSGLALRGSPIDGALRLVLTDAAPGPAGDDTVLLDRFSWRALNDELQVLRRTTDAAPAPAWRESADGQIVWANGAYLRLLADVGASGPFAWPLPALFGAAPGRGGRHSLAAGPGGRLRWFDLCPIDEGAGRLVFALPADDAQQAERARREFIQTLTKTFASLPIGLAVFDRTRRLQLFNPALTDLTRLEPEFLASRPGLDGFLNRMRDKRILPEPRDYRTWSRRLLDVETAAAGAAFEETWTLPDGRTFRVSAAPHPDGALAFLIEDVTSDMHLKRSFRAELDTGRAALDMVDTGLAVFSGTGDLVLTNAAFDRLWTLEGADTLAGVQFRDAVANWRDVTLDTGGDAGLWDRIAALGTGGAAEQRISGEMRLPDGEVLLVEGRAAAGGGVMLGFRIREQTLDLPPVAAPLPAADTLLRRARA